MLIAWSLSACVTLQDPEASQENRNQIVAVLQPGDTFEQSFESRRPAMQQMQLWLKVAQPSLTPGGKLIAELTADADDAAALTRLSYSLESLKDTTTLTIPLESPSTTHPAGAYRLRLRTEGGNVQLLGRNEDAYAQGGAFLNGAPLDADVSFRLAYDYGFTAVFEDLRAWLNGIWLALPLLALTWLPGRLALCLARLDTGLDWGERSAVAVGISLAIVPLAMLWTTALGLRWGQPAVWVVASLLAIAYLILLRPTTWKLSQIKNVHIAWPTLALAAVFIFSFAVRLAMVRDLATPAWVDSVHHSLITRLILDQGGYPDSYAPYIQVTTTSYHTGFHSLLAAFTWLSGLPLHEAMLIFGQFLNALAVLAVYLLTTTFTRKPAAGLFAALVAGLMTPMPAYYTSWGRYTQLAGLLIFPAAFLFLKLLLDKSEPIFSSLMAIKANLGLISLAGITLAGLLLVHYRVLAFLAALLAAYLVIAWIQEAFQRRPWKKIGRDLISLCVSGLLALLLTLPWWPLALSSFVIPAALAATPTKAFSDFSWSYLNTALGKYALGLAGLGLLWSLIQRRVFGLIMILWVVIMFLVANLGVFGLPGGNFINSTSVAIALFIPTALLGGYLLGWVVEGWSEWAPAKWKPLYWTIIGLAGIALALVSARSLLPILNPGTLLTRQGDLPAIEWASENIPADETILINPFLWGYGLYAGSDGGYWLSPLAGRKTFPPAALYNYDFDSENPRRISANAQKVIDLAADPVALHQLLTNEGIHYVFTGVRSGPLSPELLSASPLFELIYESQGASIFKTKNSG